MLSSRWIAFTSATSAVAVVLSVLSIPFLYGTRIHFFQLAIMLAGVVGGPLSGLVTGSIGGLYVGFLRSDPTIVIGNALLGTFTGIFAQKLRPVLASIFAWLAIQAPWIYFTGTFILGVPSYLMQFILMLLTVENVICGLAVELIVHRFRFETLRKTSLRAT